MHRPDFYLFGVPLYVHPWAPYREVVLMPNAGPEFDHRPILMASEDTMTHWMMSNLAAAYWPDGVNPDWVRMH